MRLFISAGHQANTGAQGYISEGLEAIYLRDKITSYIKEKAPNIEVANDDDKDTLQMTIQGMRTFRPDVSIDIHFNAFSDATANGSEIYVGEEKSRELATELLSAVCRTLGTRNRGVKNESSSQHTRLGMLHGADGRLMLLEVCFCTHKGDSDSYLAHRDELAEKVADILIKKGLEYDQRKEKIRGI